MPHWDWCFPCSESRGTLLIFDSSTTDACNLETSWTSLKAVTSSQQSLRCLWRANQNQRHASAISPLLICMTYRLQYLCIIGKIDMCACTFHCNFAVVFFLRIWKKIWQNRIPVVLWCGFRIFFPFFPQALDEACRLVVSADACA
jgi:hypothetical protein